MADFPVLDLGNITTDEEIKKLKEEVIEFIEAINKEDTENVIEEFYDVIQVMINLIYGYGALEEVGMGLNKHIEKINSRNWKKIQNISFQINE